MPDPQPRNYMNLNYFPSKIFFFSHFQPKNRMSSPKTTQVTDPQRVPLGILVRSNWLYLKQWKKSMLPDNARSRNSFVCPNLAITPFVWINLQRKAARIRMKPKDLPPGNGGPLQRWREG